MARKKAEEEHFNHEAWAIPYGDLLTLLLAFFVVMYAISSLNEGKYRVLSEALSAVFSGAPRSLKPVEVGPHNLSGTNTPNKIQILKSHNLSTTVGRVSKISGTPQSPALALPLPQSSVAMSRAELSLQHLNEAVVKALEPLIKKDLVHVRRTKLWLEVEIGSDMLFDSGSAVMPKAAQDVITQLADVLKSFPNALRVEGYTDDAPIHTAAFPSNWELSAARAASVVHLMIADGIDPERISLAGYGERRPIADNKTIEGRQRNRRVVIVILADNAALRAWLGDPGRLPMTLLAPATAGTSAP
ncbi:MAG TPA: flagellar motor protein MotD [Burkholderiaceae bacterium]